LDHQDTFPALRQKEGEKDLKSGRWVSHQEFWNLEDVPERHPPQ